MLTSQHRRVNLKMDLYVLPLLSLLYLMNGLDRSNVGNAAVSQMSRGYDDRTDEQTVNFTADVGMPATAVNNATSLFFITCTSHLPDWR